MKTTIAVSLGAAALLFGRLAAGQPPASPPAAAEPAASPPAPGPAPSPLAPPAAASAPSKPQQEALAGWNGGFFLRDERGWFRLYPKGRIHLDTHVFAGPGVSAVSAADGGTGLKTRFFARRLRFELAGELFQRVDFLLGVDFGGQATTNANGKAEQSAAPAGTDPTAATARYAPVQSVGAAASLANDWVNVRIVPELNLMFGQDKAPFSMENRTGNNTTTFLERNIAIRSFVFPSGKETGLTVWGDLGKDKLASYEIGIFGGDGHNRPQVDNRFDFIGRAWVRPFAAGKGALARAQIGMSGKRGERDPDYVGYAYPAIATGQGVTLWDPRYSDSQKRLAWVLPSGSQHAIGGELRLPLWRFDLRGEAYYVDNETREALDGFQLSNTERTGKVEGIGFYAQLSAWLLGDPFVSGDPGIVRPTHLDFAKEPKLDKGLEIYAIVAAIRASYDGASRSGSYDTKTPGAPGTATDIRVYQMGLGASYWYTKNIRASVNYVAYHTPGSGSDDNLATVPGNLGKEPDEDAHLLHEIGTRLGVSF